MALVAFVTLATLAAAAAAACATRAILYHRAPPRAVRTVAAKSGRHSPPALFSRHVAGAVPLCRCQRIASLPPCCHLAVAAVLVMYNDFSGHEDQAIAVSRIAFGITSSDA